MKVCSPFVKEVIQSDEVNDTFPHVASRRSVSTWWGLHLRRYGWIAVTWKACVDYFILSNRSLPAGFKMQWKWWNPHSFEQVICSTLFGTGKMPIKRMTGQWILAFGDYVITCTWCALLFSSWSAAVCKKDAQITDTNQASKSSNVFTSRTIRTDRLMQSRVLRSVRVI